VGAFSAFTLSQFGMVTHWYKKRGRHWRKSAFINGLGGTVTAITLLVIIVAKFTEGAWMTVVFIPSLISFFITVRKHYHMITVRTLCRVPAVPARHDNPAIGVIPVDRWSCITKEAIEFASKITPEMIAVHVDPGEASQVLIQEEWKRYVEEPFRQRGARPPELVLLPSPYRFVIIPIVQYILDLSEKHKDRQIVVVIPELVESRWYEYFLHNQRGRLLEWMLMARGNERIYTVSAPYYLREPNPETSPPAEKAFGGPDR
jgi:hypothetical protein